MSFVEAIGVVAGVLGIVQFGLTNFGDDSEPGSTIKVAVGLDGNTGTEDAGGDLPDIRVWNDFGDFKGMTSDPGNVGDGTVGQVEIDHDQQGVYSLFSANTDAICIAWVTTTWSDAAGGNKFAVSGDYGEACGGTWYESNMWTDTDSQSYKPKCFWIDADGDQPNTGFQVRWPRYSKDQFDEGNTDPANICNDIDFGLRTEEDPSDINFWTAASKTRRDVNERRMHARRGTRAAWTAEQLVVSDDSKHHSAHRLCDSETSMGPDFVHLAEGFFCDMGSKTKYPLCGGGSANSTVTDSCFDLDSHHLLHAGSKRGDFTKRDSPYSKIRDWRSNKN